MYEIVQHTADVRMRVSAPTREGLFAEALHGLMDLVKAEGAAGEEVKARIDLTAPDETSLLVDFLNEVLTRCAIRREVYTRAVFGSMTDTSLSADLEGHRVERFGEDVKAVTYHEAEVRRHGGAWSTMLLFDI
jgi:SHS2 domain-containing protein